MRATTATCAECLQSGLGREKQDTAAEMLHKMTDDPAYSSSTPEALTANMISVIEYLAYKNNAFIIIL